MGGEVPHQLDLLIGERQNLLAVYADYSDQLAFLEHRNQQKSSSTCEFENWLARIFRSEVDDVDRLLCAGKAIKNRRRGARYDLVMLVSVNHSLRCVMHRDSAKNFAFVQKQVSEISRTNLRRVRQHGLKHWLKLTGRRTDYFKHFRGRRLLLQRLGKVARARLHLVKQPHILDGNYSLVGKGSNQLDLLVGERLHLGTTDREYANGLALPQQRNG